MCGIAAAVGRPAAVAEIVDELRHRGPDASGIHRDGDVALGAARLRINGDARFDQPLRAGDDVVLVANAEVFNHASLDVDVTSSNDLMPLATTLRREGPQALGRVRGPFAVAAWHRSTGRLILSRDEVGVRQLYVLESPSGILAASEPWPLLKRAGCAPQIDRRALAHLLAFQFLPRDATLFRGLRPVVPGETWLVGGDSARAVVRYPVRYTGPSEIDLSSALRSTARLQGPTAQRSAVFLSGGLDSSAVAGLLCAAGTPPSLAIVGFFPDAPHLDERPHARAVARELGLDLVEVPITADDAWDAFASVVRRLGGPQAGPGALAQFVLAREAARLGVKVVFTGTGGDELFGGYERHRILQRLARGEAASVDGTYAALAAAMSRAPDPLSAAVFRGREWLDALIPSSAAETEAIGRFALPAQSRDRADAALAFENATFLPGLLAVDDVTLAAFGIEGRAPLLDPVVTALARRIPLCEKSPPDAPRRLFREAVGAALPEAAKRRTDKMGFPMPLDAWLDGPWAERARELVAGDGLARFGFDPARVRKAFESRSVSARGRWFALALAVLDRLVTGELESSA